MIMSRTRATTSSCRLRPSDRLRAFAGRLAGSGLHGPSTACCIQYTRRRFLGILVCGGTKAAPDTLGALRRQRSRKRVGERSVSEVTHPSAGVLPFAIVDAHQHFWDPARNYYPVARDEPPIPFRYGDYRAIRRRYLPPDYRADAAPVPSSTSRSTSRPNGIRATRSARCATSTRCGASTDCRRSRSRRPGSTATTRRACSSSRRRSRSCAACATSRAPTLRPATRRPAA